MTVKKLIEKLQELENKYLEVYVVKGTDENYYAPVKEVAKVNTKAIIFLG